VFCLEEEEEEEDDNDEDWFISFMTKLITVL